MKKRYSISSVIICFVFAVFSIIFMLPLLWTLFSSLKPESSIMGDPARFFPTEYTLVHYNTLLTQIPFFRFLLNSVIFTGGVTISSLLFDSLAGYAFAKLKFRGSNVCFVIVLVSMMIPFQITMIPLYLFMNKMHVINTYAGLILPRLTNAFGVVPVRTG